MGEEKSQTESLKLHFPGYQLELEVKFLTDAATMDRLLSHIEDGAPFIPEPVARDERTNIYYDTGSFSLYAKAYECRGRESKGAKYKYDLKTPDSLKKPRAMPDKNGIFARREYSDDGTGQTPRLALFDKDDLSDTLKKEFDKKLHPLVCGKFKRKRFSFAPTGHPDSLVEIAMENGYFETLDGRHRSEQLYMIELELKSGTRAALIAASQTLQERYNLTIYDRTKGDMGISFTVPFMDDKKQKKFAEAAAARPADPETPPPAPITPSGPDTP